MAEHDANPPPDGFYWFERPNRDVEVVQVERGEISVIDGDDEAFRLESWPEGRYRLSVIEGRLLGRIPEPGQPPAAYMSPDGTRTMPAVIFDDWKAQRPDDAAGWVALAPIVQPGCIDHADLLRRYVALVVAEEGYDYTERLHGGRSVDGITFTPEELAHLKALSAEANDGSAS